MSVRVTLTWLQLLTMRSSYGLRIMAMSELRKAGAPVEGSFYPQIKRGTLTQEWLLDGSVRYTWRE